MKKKRKNTFEQKAAILVSDSIAFICCSKKRKRKFCFWFFCIEKEKGKKEEWWSSWVQQSGPCWTQMAQAQYPSTTKSRKWSLLCVASLMHFPLIYEVLDLELLPKWAKSIDSTRCLASMWAIVGFDQLSWTNVPSL